MVIGVTGYKGSGKDTVGRIIQEMYGLDHYSFAGPLKAGILAIFGWQEQHLSDPVFKERVDPDWGVSPRQVMQWMGTEVMREAFQDIAPHIGTDFWIRRFSHWVNVHKYLPGYRGVVVTDVRFPNEINAIHAAGGLVLRVHRTSTVPSFVEHASEDIGALPVDEVIPNDGTLEELRVAVAKTMKALGKKGWKQNEIEDLR